MNKEINYLKEHLYEIYKYKKSQKDLTYDMDLELLLRTCKALDFIQQENKKLKKQKDDVLREINFYETTEWGLRGYEILEKFRRMLGEIECK